MRLFRSGRKIGDRRPLLPLGDSLGVDAVTLGKRSQAFVSLDAPPARSGQNLGIFGYAMVDIAQAMGRTQQSLGPARASIIAKGMIYSTDHGYVDFSVPLFAEFLRRQ